jgi:hypothetical protein
VANLECSVSSTLRKFVIYLIPYYIKVEESHSFSEVLVDVKVVDE